MCGVIGYDSGGPTKENFLPVLDLFRQSTIRGMHAFGYKAAWPDGQRRSGKFHALGDLLDELFLMASEPPSTLIGHTRYSTSGDWTAHANNQPVERDGYGLVFNGVIDMGTREEMEERYGVTLDSDNDGELALRWFIDRENGNPENFKLLHSKTGRSFAGIFMAPNGWLCIYRNEHRPLYTLGLQTRYIASTRDIFQRAGFSDYKDASLVPMDWALLSPKAVL